MSDAPITAKFQEKAPIIMALIMQRITPRLSDEDAAAVLGSFGVETGGFTIREEAGGGGGYGWAQWTGERRDDMERWCEANEYDPYHEDEYEYDTACMEFFIHEITETWEKRVLTEGGTISGVYYPPLSLCTTLDQKTEAFWRLFERPGVPHEDWRREMAHEALRLYRGEPAGSKPMPYSSIVISSGHGLLIRGAHGVIDEVDEARRVVDQLAHELRARGCEVVTFHDNTSTSQSQNLNTIVNYHNSKTRDLDVSVHFNAYEQVSKPMGTEVLYVTQAALADRLSAAIASCGFVNRGPKKRTDLMFLNSTEMPAVLLEVCFVDSEADCDIYGQQFDAICTAIADELGGAGQGIEPPVVVEPGPEPLPPARIDIETSGDVIVTINGQQITSQSAHNSQKENEL